MEQGKIINQNLSGKAAADVKRLKELANKGNVRAMYSLGCMYLESEDVGYDPIQGEEYLKMGARLNDFDCNYALALFYKGNWSYQHLDAHKSWSHYLAAQNCKIDDPVYINEVKRAIDNDFGVEKTRKGIAVWLKGDYPIK